MEVSAPLTLGSPYAIICDNKEQGTQKMEDQQEKYKMKDKLDFGKLGVYPVLDAKLGECKKITIEEGTESGLAPRCPITIMAALIITYEKGERSTLMSPMDMLSLGQVQCYSDEGEPGFLCNKQLIAAIGLEIATLGDFLKGEIPVPTEEEAERIIKELDIPYPPITLVEAQKTRPYIERDWLIRWMKTGKLCYMNDTGNYEIESTIPENRKENIGKTGAEVARMAIKQDLVNELGSGDEAEKEEDYL